MSDMPKKKIPRIPGQAVVDQLEKRLARYDRGPFQGMLADALSVKPSRTAWRKLAAKNPERYVAAVSQLAKPAGFGERSETLSVSMDLTSLAETLVARHGADKAQKMLGLFGLPASLAENSDTTTTIEGEASHVEDDKLRPDGTESATEPS